MKVQLRETDTTFRVILLVVLREAVAVDAVLGFHFYGHYARSMLNDELHFSLALRSPITRLLSINQRQETLQHDVLGHCALELGIVGNRIGDDGCRQMGQSAKQAAVAGIHLESIRSLGTPGLLTL